MVVAPLVDQLRVLLEPAFMLAGVALKELTAGSEPVPGLATEPAQPIMPEPASAKITSAQKASTADLGSTGLRFLLPRELRVMQPRLDANSHHQFSEPFFAASTGRKGSMGMTVDRPAKRFQMR